MKSNTNKQKIEALKISNETYNLVMERDNNSCVLCSLLGYHPMLLKDKCYILEMHHFVSRAKLGMGIEQNLVMLCKYHHMEYTKYEKEITKYLKSKYEHWNKENLVFKKGL